MTMDYDKVTINKEYNVVLGIVIREEDILQRLAAKGKKDLTGQAILQDKAEETLNIVYEQSKNDNN